MLSLSSWSISLKTLLIIPLLYDYIYDDNACKEQHAEYRAIEIDYAHMELFHSCSALAAVITAALHSESKLLGVSERCHKSGISTGIRALAFCISEPVSISAPLAFCADIILSVSSIRVGINLRAIVIIIASSWTGTFIFSAVKAIFR